MLSNLSIPLLEGDPRRIAMVERGMIGGTCINVACIPTKTLLNSGRVLETVRRAAEFGISGVEDPRMDLALLRHRKDDVVGTMVKGQLGNFTDSGMDFILGEAKFTGPRTVHVDLNDGGTRLLRGTDVVINLGTEPALPPIAGLAEARVETSNTLLELESLPESIVILGGGYIGCEFADLLNIIGVKCDNRPARKPVAGPRGCRHVRRGQESLYRRRHHRPPRRRSRENTARCGRHGHHYP